MSKSFIKIFILSCLLLLFSICITAQTKARPRVNTFITGVYAGFSLPLIGVNGDMQTYMRTFYFRENGTYATEFDEPDWQTRVDGNYKIIGNKLIIQSNLDGDSPSEIEIKENGGFLFYNGAGLLKLNAVSSIPAVIVKNNSGASSGGIGTNSVFVAVSSSDLYNFDGSGKFSHNSSSASVVSGVGVGGGSSKDKNGGGTYTVKDGLLTLNYISGKVVKKSFFYSESDGNGTALIDGSFHFETEESKKIKSNVITNINSETKNSQSKSSVITTLNGAYAGSSTTFVFNAGMQNTYYSYYFRPNGTYTTNLDQPDWQTDVEGTYKINGKKVTLYPKKSGEENEEMDIAEEGESLVWNGRTLFKLKVMNSIPAVLVEKTGGSSSGGIGTGTVFVGVSFYGVYNFDGKGNFSNNSSSATIVSGESVGGGSSKDSGGDGTYTIKNSLLTLKYKNGKIETKSFFYVEFDGDGTALINGSFYYEPDEDQKVKTNETTTVAKTPIAKEISPIESAEKREDLIIKSSRMLKLANLAHGGDKLDALKTIRLTGKALGFDITILVDATNQKVRNEFRKKDKLILVEQLDGKDSWQWGDNLKSPLTNEKRNELKKSLMTGLFALQSNAIKSGSYQTADLNLKGNLKSLLALIDGEKYGMIFDADNRLAAELSSENGVLQTTYSSDYRNVSGIMIPFKSKVTLGEKSIEVKFSAVEVNPYFSEKDWNVPN
jgi:hypothetical protein